MDLICWKQIYVLNTEENNSFTSELFFPCIASLNGLFSLMRSLCFLFSNREYSFARYSVTEKINNLSWLAPK